MANQNVAFKLKRRNNAFGIPCKVFNTVSGFGGNDSNLLIVFYVQIMPDDFVMQLHRF